MAYVINATINGRLHKVLFGGFGTVKPKDTDAEEQEQEPVNQFPGGGGSVTPIEPPTPQKQDAGINWSLSTCSATIGANNTYPTLVNPHNLVGITYTSSNTSVATINASGNITLVSDGTTIITANYAGNASYYAKTVSYTLTVSPAIPEKQPAGLAWSSNAATVTIGGTNVYPTLTNPHNLTVTYSSSNTSIATISNSGVISLISSGTTTISAIFTGNSGYYAQTVSYTLTVNPAQPVYDLVFEGYLASFSSYITVNRDTATYNYMKLLYDEAVAQYRNRTSTCNIPVLYNTSNFPVVYNYFGSTKDVNACFDTLIGWLFAMQFSELKPVQRTNLYKIGYELGGYTKNSKLYGYECLYDPNVNRLIASVIYAAMRGKQQPNIATMRSEVGGSTYSDTLSYYSHDASRTDVGAGDFYIDLREFMPTAAGPYAPGYTNRSNVGGYPFPNDTKSADYNLQMDLAIHNDIITKYNLNNQTYLQDTVQAIADKDLDTRHLFGPSRTAGQYTFNSVFNSNVLGTDVNSSLYTYYDDVRRVGTNARMILQSGIYYGRLRPGCSWSREEQKHSTSDDRMNVLTNFTIEDNDGSPTGYYDQGGNWVNPSVQSAAQYEELQKNSLYANSYPSGHSSGIWNLALVLIEQYPAKADKIMVAANKYAVNRTVTRYHWTSDTIQGRVLGSAINPVMHACNGFGV